jgi:serine/threonine-protein kinase HipA
MKKIEKILVYIDFDASKKKVGELVVSANTIYFKYDSDFLNSGLNISPFKLPLNNTIVQAPITPFNGLFGVFNDSLPDGWGKLLLDRNLQNKGINPNQISPLDRLSFVGKNGMGALTYQPEFEENTFSSALLDLDLLHKEMNIVLNGESSEIIDDLFLLGGSSGGARPKINIGYNPTTSHIIHDDGNLPEGFEPWIIKFPSSFDQIDAAQIEFVYHKMAIAAGLEMMPCQLFEGKTGRYYFGTKRFDRNHNNRTHLHTASGLLHDDFRMSSLDYGHLMDAAFQLEKDIRVYEKILRLAAFNLYSHNRDDHSKNFSFLMTKNGIWQLAPVYDLTFSFSSFGSHSTSFAGEYKNPTQEHLIELANVFGIKNPKPIIEEVKQAISNWKNTAKLYNVSTESTKLIEKTIENLLRQ